MPLSRKQNINDANARQRRRSPLCLELLQALYDAVVGVGWGSGVSAMVTCTRRRRTGCAVQCSALEVVPKIEVATAVEQKKSA